LAVRNQRSQNESQVNRPFGPFTGRAASGVLPVWFTHVTRDVMAGQYKDHVTDLQY